MKDTTANILKLVILIGIVVGICFLVYYASVGEFLVTHGTTEYKAETVNAVSVESGQAYYFRCKATKGVAGFDVYVVPTTQGKSLRFTLDGVICSFGEDEDLTSGFNIETSANGFVLIVPSGFSLQHMLENAYAGYSVTADGKLGKNFALLIVPKNNSDAVVIDLNFLQGGQQ